MCGAVRDALFDVAKQSWGRRAATRHPSRARQEVVFQCHTIQAMKPLRLQPGRTVQQVHQHGTEAPRQRHPCEKAIAEAPAESNALLRHHEQCAREQLRLPAGHEARRKIVRERGESDM